MPANPNKEMADKDVFGPVDPSCLFYNNNKQWNTKLILHNFILININYYNNNNNNNKIQN